LLDAPAYLLGCAGQQVEREGRVDAAANLDRFLCVVALEGQDDAQINIGGRSWPTVGIRAEQDDAFGVEFPCDARGQRLDIPPVDHGAVPYPVVDD